MFFSVLFANLEIKKASVQFYNKSGDILLIETEQINRQTNNRIDFYEIFSKIIRSNVKTFTCAAKRAYYLEKTKKLYVNQDVEFRGENLEILAQNVVVDFETYNVKTKGNIKAHYLNLFFDTSQMNYNHDQKIFEFPQKVKISVMQ